MITVILEDKKGFKKSFDIPKFRPYIDIPLRPDSIRPAFIGVNRLSAGRLRFRFHEWLKKGEVALYREK